MKNWINTVKTDFTPNNNKKMKLTLFLKPSLSLIFTVSDSVLFDADGDGDGDKTS